MRVTSSQGTTGNVVSLYSTIVNMIYINIKVLTLVLLFLQQQHIQWQCHIVLVLGAF